MVEKKRYYTSSLDAVSYHTAKYNYLGKINQSADQDVFVPHAKNVTLNPGILNNPLLLVLDEVDYF